MKRILYLDQNAWIALLRGAWNRETCPAEYDSLCRIRDAVCSGRILIPLSYANIYETLKINDPQRRTRLSHLQTAFSNGIVLRSRSQVLRATLTRYFQERMNLPVTSFDDGWFLSDLFIEAALEYRPDDPRISLWPETVEMMREYPAWALHCFLTRTDETLRQAATQQFSAQSVELLANMNVRRQLIASEPFSTRLRLYRAQLIHEQLELILAVGRSLGLAWQGAQDIGSSLVKGITHEVAVMRVECELAARLEDQGRELTENDFRDMLAFAVALPSCDIMVAENLFTAMARQAKLGKMYSTILLTSVAEVTDAILRGEMP